MKPTIHRIAGTPTQFTDTPKERLQVIANPTVDYGDGGAAGIEALGSAFGNFFKGAQSGLAEIQNAQAHVELSRIRDENAAQKKQATVDALKGSDRDPALTDDLDYIQTYDKTAGIKAGIVLSEDAKKAMLDLPVDTDIRGWLNDYIEKETKGHSGSTDFDAHMLATFRNQMLPSIDAWNRNLNKHVKITGLDNLATEAYSAANDGTLSATSLADMQQRAVALFNGDPGKAKKWLISSLSAGADSLPALHKLTSALNESGFGPNGESFAKLFPAAADQIDAKATTGWLSRTSVEGFSAYANLEQQLTDPSVLSDPKAFMALAPKAAAVFSKYGDEPRFRHLQAQFKKNLTSLSNNLAGLYYMNEKATNQIKDVDQSKINKFQQMYLQSADNIFGRAIDPLSSPQDATAAALVVTRSGGIATGLKATMNAALGNSADPKAQANAFRFFKGLDAQGLAQGYLSDEAKRVFNAVNHLYDGNDSSLVPLFERLNANPELKALGNKPAEFNWKQLMGATSGTESDALMNATTALYKSVGSSLGISANKLTFSQDALDTLRWNAAANIKTNRAAGVGDAVDLGIADAAKGMVGRIVALPATDGKTQIVLNKVPAEAPVVDNGAPVRNSDGSVKMQQVVLPGMSVNPASGDMENTNDVFREDADALAKMLPGEFDSGGLSVSMGRAANLGVFNLLSDGKPVWIVPGQKFIRSDSDWPGIQKFKRWFGITPDSDQNFTLSSDPTEARKQLEKELPDQFVVIPHDTEHGVAFELGYKFRHRTLPEISDLESNYKGAAGFNTPSGYAFGAFGGFSH